MIFACDASADNTGQTRGHFESVALTLVIRETCWYEHFHNAYCWVGNGHYLALGMTL